MLAGDGYTIRTIAVKVRSPYECLDRARNVLQVERAQRLERQVEPVVHMIAHGARDADEPRRTFRLQPCRDDHAVAVQVGAVGDRVADVDPDAKADAAIVGVARVVGRHLLLHVHGTAHRALDAVEHDQQRIAAGLHHTAAILRDRRVDHLVAQRAQAFECTDIIETDQPAVAEDVGIDHGDQLAAAAGRLPLLSDGGITDM